MKTTALSVDSAVARMVRLVEEAQNQRSSTEMLVERIAKYYTPGKPSIEVFLSCEINTRYCHVLEMDEDAIILWNFCPVVNVFLYLL